MSVSPPKFSILIPTWNNLVYAKLCVESLKKNSYFDHQIILHINAGVDGTLEWARANQILHTHSAENVGVCYALNEAATLASTDYIVFMNDDMYVCPDWDRLLWEEITKIKHQEFFLSSTMIEPTETGNACVIGGKDFGTTAENFAEQDLLNQYSSFNKADWQGATWPPNVLPRQLWHKVGGYSVEFSPGMYSDPDFSRKLWHAGVRLFKGIGKSRVYHFQCKSTGKVVKNDGKRQFLKKWDLSASHFNRFYLRRGELFTSSLEDPSPNLKLKLAKASDYLRARLSH